MVRAWRQQAGALLVAFMVLDLLTFIYTRTAEASLNAGQPVAGQLLWLALDGFLAWRIWRHGRVAWAVLLALTAILLLLIVLGSVWPWSPHVLGFLAILAAQTMLLISPAIRMHVRQT
jgi:hypothetical protein